MVIKFIRKNIIHILTIMFVLFFLTDRILVILDKNPIFTLFANYHKDGGTECRIGLGYSVILWNQLAIKEENGNEIHGHKIGKEFVYFPICYLKFYGYNFKPKSELKFVTDNEIIDDVIQDIILGKILGNNFLSKFVVPFLFLGYFMPIIYTIIIMMFFVYYIKILRKRWIIHKKKHL